ncbi:hypothetical protein C5C53_12200 [Rathayibacter sp. AY1E3]|nr:hypothetical protein C5E14_15310 [Rathayibacter sp. AY1A1]PPG99462.1 hypothetical protein C5C32_11865 [Rathayibacter sp. AY1G9]PPH35689.1 hypothetical protein C5C53_12200 [Rathayibacter sp. AY1E3]
MLCTPASGWSAAERASGARPRSCAHLLDEAALSRIDQATDLLLGERLRGSGRSFSPAEIDVTALPPRPGTSFGIWCPEPRTSSPHSPCASDDAPHTQRRERPRALPPPSRPVDRPPCAQQTRAG